MPPMLTTTGRLARFQRVSKGVAVIASTAAALGSVVTALYTYGVIGKSASHKTFANFGAAWVQLRPAVDTATAIGDTVRFAATVADKSGSILVGAVPIWTTGDSAVAVVTSDGSVIARHPGTTTVTAVAGSAVSSARVIVTQRVTAVAIANPVSDTAAIIAEGSQVQLRAHALDARGHLVMGRTVAWHVDDTTAATTDAHGLITGVAAGRAVVSATIDGSAAYLPITIVTPAHDLAILAGDGQHSPAGRVLPQRIVVRATTLKGAPAVGKTVTFRLESAEGKVIPVTAVTDRDGRARAQWTLGSTPGRQRLFASVENVDTASIIEADAAPVAKNTRLIPLATLHAHYGRLLTDSVGVRVTDSLGRSLPNLPVHWTAVDGALMAGDARTDSMGVARVRWTLASRTGLQRLRAFVGVDDSPIPPATIVAIALPGAPAKVEVVSGDRQRGHVAQALAKSIVLRVVDSAGNNVVGVPVVLTPSGGSLEDSAAVTDSLGLARVHWTMGRSSGDYRLAIQAGGLKTLQATAYATPGAAANIALADAPPIGGDRVNVRRLVARVTDVYDNPVPDAPVRFSAKSGAVNPTRAVTDERGRVSLVWTVAPSATDVTLTGAVRGSDVTGAYVLTAVQQGRTKKSL